jgi:NOL1/NOP2/fmu family ribosome biogenesis protein
MSGFFCALMTLKKPIFAAKEPPPGRDFSATHLHHVDQKFQENIAAQISQNYGFDLFQILEEYSLGIYQRFDHLFLIPLQYLERFINLPYEYIGLPLGQWIREGLVPSHPFISRFGNQFNKGKIQIDEANVSLWIAGRDIRYPETSLDPRGQYLVVTDDAGRNLGLGKLLPKRLRNMLPRGSI